MNSGLKLALRWFLLAVFPLSSALSFSSSSEEQAEAGRWVAAKFEGKLQAAPEGSYLSRMGDRGRIDRNSRPGRALQILDTQYARGLYVDHAQGVSVHLSSPAKSLDAVIGLDGSYAGCSYTSTNQEFAVKAGEKLVLPPQLVRVATPAVPIHADLGGATDFTLENGRDPKKEWCGEAVWADAKVSLENGETVWLGDLPFGPAAQSFTSAVPFSFKYGGVSSAELLRDWRRQRSVRELDQKRTEYTTSFRDPATGLLVEWVGVAYHDFPVAEWTLWFENTGSVDSPILEDIAAVDTWFQRAEGNEFLLHHFRGSPAGPTDFEPFESKLAAKSELHIAASGGRPTDHALCYFNADQSDRGVMIGLGWPGEWAADFSRDDDRGLRIRAGQELTHFKLLPGERVRAPRVALMFWQGDWIRGQNAWRKWMLAYNLPRPHARQLTPKVAASSALWYGEMTRADEASQKLFLDRYRQEKIGIDYWWMDAGWYVNNGSWGNTGTWQIDPKRFPAGLRPVDDLAHSLFIQPIVWFELERVTRGTWLWETHPDWLLKAAQEEQRGQRLLNLGRPEVVAWIVDYLDKFVRQQAIDVYRIDFNIRPLPFWRENEPRDRQGITENKYVMGFLEYLDKLKSLHPELLIDTCASGGGRDDLETLLRAVPMHRSDYSYEPVGQQNITYGMSFWIPYFGSPNVARDNYVFRSAWGPQLNLGWDVRRPDLDYAWMRKAVSQWRLVAPNYFGDYYPLTPYSASSDAWMAWQFHRPEVGEGVVEAFRRASSVFDSAQLELHGLEPTQRYEVTSVDEPGSQILSGEELMHGGFKVVLKQKPAAGVFTYRPAGRR